MSSLVATAETYTPGYTANSLSFMQRRTRLEQDGDMVSAAAFREWALHPDALFVQPWLEGMGWKDGAA